MVGLCLIDIAVVLRIIEYNRVDDFTVEIQSKHFKTAEA